MNLIIPTTTMPVTLGIMAIILIFSLAGFKKESFYRSMVHHPVGMIKNRQYYRLITFDFVHNDFVHLVVNEGMAYFLCGSLEEFLNKQSAYGSLQFLFIYLVSHFTGAVFTTLRHGKHFDYSSAGASGSILGCMMSYMILDPNQTAFYLPIVGGVKNIYAGLIVIVGLIIYQWRTGNDMMDHELHFYSTIGGIIATVVLFPQFILS
jgi:membrane associated rhomboid family serine protease